MPGTVLKRTAVIVAVAAALVVPAQAAAGAPTATKSGVLINYADTGKIKIAKKMAITLVCSASCNVETRTVIKGPRFKDSFEVSGPLTAGIPGGPFFNPNGPLLKAMKDKPGKFKIQSSATATDPATGAVETINRTFRIKR
jgi:hypothetical protein